MRTSLAVSTSIGALAVIASAAAAIATPTNHAAVTSSATVMHLLAHQHSEKSLDLADPGFGVGDMDLSAASLTRGTDDVGSFDGVCQVTIASKSKADQLCTQTLSLPRGSIVSTGTVASGRSGPAPFDWAITGGTGAYATARGYIHVLPGNKTVRLIVHLAR